MGGIGDSRMRGAGVILDVLLSFPSASRPMLYFVEHSIDLL